MERKIEEIINKGMHLGELKRMFNIKWIAVPTLDDIDSGMRNGMISVDIKEKSHTNIYFKYTNARGTYIRLLENNEEDKLYIEITKIENMKKEEGKWIKC